MLWHSEKCSNRRRRRASNPQRLRFLCAVQIDGNTSPTPSGSWDNDSLDYNTYYVTPQPYKIITGSYSATLHHPLTTCIQKIMQSGVQVALNSVRPPVHSNLNHVPDAPGRDPLPVSRSPSPRRSDRHQAPQ